MVKLSYDISAMNHVGFMALNPTWFSAPPGGYYPNCEKEFNELMIDNMLTCFDIYSSSYYSLRFFTLIKLISKPI